jgi:hypothetical protein
MEYRSRQLQLWGISLSWLIVSLLKVYLDSLEVPSPALEGLSWGWSLFRVCDIEVSDVSGCLFPPRAHSFLRLGGFPSVPVPVPSRVRVVPLLSFTSSSETCCLRLALRPRALSTSQGFLPLRDISPWSPLHGELPSSRLRSAPSVSRALDGLLLHAPYRLISSCCHVRDSRLRGFPRCQAGSPHRRVVPSCRLPEVSSR